MREKIFLVFAGNRKFDAVSELVVGDIAVRYAKVGQHFEASLDHQGWTAQVVLDPSWTDMLA
jgi:hypothetical protein